MTIQIGVLVSGRGSNLEAILASMERGSIRGAKVSIVISNNPSAKALRIARRHGAKAMALPDEGLSREDYCRKLATSLTEHGVKPGEGLVLLAGFMKILSKDFVELYKNRMMNIHPALLPSFPGLHAQLQALSHGVKVSGCTVHFVVPEVDAGPIIVQRAVPVKEEDDEDSLASRILRQEHRAYPEAVRLFVEGKLRVDGRKVEVLR